MSIRSAKLEALEQLEGTPIPDTTVRLSRPTVQGGPWQDTVAQITKIAVNQTPGDHYFALTLPDETADYRGRVEVDNSAEGDPRLIIDARGIFKDPGVIGPLVRAGLMEAGVDSAVVESQADTNLSVELLRDAARLAGGTILEATDEILGEPLVVFEAITSNEIGELVAA